MFLFSYFYFRCLSVVYTGVRVCVNIADCKKPVNGFFQLFFDCASGKHPADIIVKFAPNVKVFFQLFCIFFLFHAYFHNMLCHNYLQCSNGRFYSQIGGPSGLSLNISAGK